MAETKFTRGKCYVDFRHNHIEIVGPAKKYRRFGVDGERTLATVGDDFSHFYDDLPELEREDRANAHLYAAASELYEALADMTELLERIGDSRKDAPIIDAARVALAKAREGNGGNNG